MGDQLLQVADGFWNIRGSFSIGIIPIGTQASLVRMDDGRFVLLDAYTLSDELLGQVRDLTSGGRDVDAILNLHPFHTLHVERAHQQFPGARLFGSERHVAKASGLPWQDLRVDDPRLHEEFADGLQFTVPRGVDFISKNEQLHFSSVLAYHPASKTIHVDDTLNYAKLPLIGSIGLRFHPTLKQVLEPRAGAADDFRGWVDETATRWKDARNICSAHNAVLLDDDGVAGRIQGALKRVERTLKSHQRAHG